jgi:geranylgeranyl diphosphate synthase type I
VRGPLALGHRIAGGSADTWRALENYAQPIGVAFQLRDDMIGTFGDEKETGKSAGSDIRQGKRTAPIAEALTRLTGAAQSELESLLGTESAEGVARARALVESSGACEAVEKRIEELRARALSALESGPIRTEGRERLAGLARMLTERRT